MKDLVSIIVPVYNVELYIKRCLDSIINQTYKNLEIILVDDGSTDNSGVICDQYKSKDERVIVIHKLNGGLSSARNAGLDICTGEYISFVDSDDYVDKEYIELLYRELKKDDIDMSLCGLVVEQEIVEKKKINYVPELKYAIYSGKELLSHCIIFSNENLWNSACGKLYKRSIFNVLRFPYGKLHEDEYILDRVLCKSKRVVVISNNLYHYIKRANSITYCMTSKNYHDDFEAMMLRFINLYNMKFDRKTLSIQFLLLLERYVLCKKKCKANDISDIKKMIRNNKKYINEYFIECTLEEKMYIIAGYLYRKILPISLRKKILIRKRIML